MPRPNYAFTLTELLVAVAVLALVILFVTRLVDSAGKVATLGQKRIDSDSQARQQLDRMAIDFTQMVKRSDVDYYLKSSANLQPGNDQMAFYSAVSSYYPSTSSSTQHSPVSLVAYRINSQNKLERMGKGLIWSGINLSAATTPSPVPIVFNPLTIAATWPAATNTTAADSDYEEMAPGVFRFEYYYLLKTGSFSVTPWNTSAGHTSVRGMQDVAAMVVAIAAMDPKSKVLLTPPQVTALAGRLKDVSTSATATDINGATMAAGDLLANWQSALDAVTDLPRAAISAIRPYERYFYISPPTYD